MASLGERMRKSECCPLLWRVDRDFCGRGVFANEDDFAMARSTALTHEDIRRLGNLHVNFFSTGERKLFKVGGELYTVGCGHDALGQLARRRGKTELRFGSARERAITQYCKRSTASDRGVPSGGPALMSGGIKYPVAGNGALHAEECGFY